MSTIEIFMAGIYAGIIIYLVFALFAFSIFARMKEK